MLQNFVQRCQQSFEISHFQGNNLKHPSFWMCYCVPHSPPSQFVSNETYQRATVSNNPIEKNLMKMCFFNGFVNTGQYLGPGEVVLEFCAPVPFE